ncbi:hypothetical protein [Paracoccus sp. TOH]|uniref:hypothetical protein n=1 Tax=Paracoccus sp. TOH TaxID=1263728 RepID=UPI0025AFBE1B|nr:hypothetical protein [Paracoccus sp. TOH]WJS86341.1 hypothetical protein NBE95_13315 [Paracoccus sp. TOH]
MPSVDYFHIMFEGHEVDPFNEGGSARGHMDQQDGDPGPEEAGQEMDRRTKPGMRHVERLDADGTRQVLVYAVTYGGADWIKRSRSRG